MISPDQIDKLATKLTELTVKDKVEWKETGNATIYLASVDKFVVTINRTGSEVSGGFSFQILDRTGRAVEGVIAHVGREKSDSENANWERLRPVRNRPAARFSSGKSGLRPPCVTRAYRLTIRCTFSLVR
jgi:hypothetical protein